jgi:hypothetical protein
VREFVHQEFERHAVLQVEADRGGEGVHQAGNRGPFLCHRDEDLAGRSVVVSVASGPR